MTPPPPPLYWVYRAPEGGGALLGWDATPWIETPAIQIDHFRPESSAHRPLTEARLAYDEHSLRGIFRVRDQFVLCRRMRYGDDVWKDSCVEFFVQPRLERGYFNFEFNCGGAFLCSYITDSARTSDGFKKFVRLPAEMASFIRVETSLRGPIEKEIPVPLTWELGFAIPRSLIESFVGPLGPLNGQIWRANFYKCAEENSHPHWAAWSPVDELNFHLPCCFGQIQFQ